jgi:hypothetical protein
MTISGSNRRLTDFVCLASLRHSLRGFVEWAEDVAPPGKVRAGFEFTARGLQRGYLAEKGPNSKRSKWLRRGHIPKTRPALSINHF